VVVWGTSRLHFLHLVHCVSHVLPVCTSKTLYYSSNITILT
jgi:hypothetical protein